MTFRFGPNHKNTGRVSEMSPTLRKAFSQRNIVSSSYPIKTKKNAIKLIYNLNQYYEGPSCPTTKSLSRSRSRSRSRRSPVIKLQLPKRVFQTKTKKS